MRMNYHKIAARIANLVLVFGIAFATLPAQAAVPITLSYQGQLANAAGVPVNGTVNITFSLYELSGSTSPIWAETKSVAVSNGMYSVILGGDTPLDAGMFGAPRYLGIRVGADPEMTPRITLSSSATALRAAVADSAITAATADALAPTAAVAGSQITGTLSNVTISGATFVDMQLSAAAVCDAAHAGALRWVAATKSFEGCTGTVWVTIIQEPLIRIATVDTLVPYGDYNSSIRIGADGMPMIVYYGKYTGDLMVAHCGNAVCSAGNTITAVDTAGDVGWNNSIAIGADGLPVIAYTDVTNNDLKVAKCGNAACSAGNTIISVDTIGNVGGWASISIGADGLPVIAYIDATNLDLKVAHCGNAACSADNTLTAVDTVGSVGLTTSISIGADGLPVIAYIDTTNLDLKVAKCGDAACSAGNTITTVDAGSVDSFTSISIGADGLPVIAYRNTATIKVAKCGDAACTVSTLAAVDFGMNGYLIYPSLAIGTDGLPVISYYSQYMSDLKVAHCGNAACSAGTVVSSLDTAGIAGYGTSIAIGNDGLPVISYYSDTGLKVAHCGKATCLQN